MCSEEGAKAGVPAHGVRVEESGLSEQRNCSAVTQAVHSQPPSQPQLFPTHFYPSPGLTPEQLPFINYLLSMALGSSIAQLPSLSCLDWVEEASSR